MIAKLKGLVDEIAEHSVIIDVGGVCYRATCSGRTLSKMPRVGEAVTLLIETHVREDQFSLFGFMDEGEKEWFKLLQSVQGVGAKVALGILSTLTAEELSHAITMQDKTMVTRAQGVGPKLAVRIVNELKDKVPAGAVAAFSTAKTTSDAQGAAPVKIGQDAISALINLGYRQAEAGAAVQRGLATIAQAGEDPTVEVLIRMGLKELAA